MSARPTVRALVGAAVVVAVGLLIGSDFLSDDSSRRERGGADERVSVAPAAERPQVAAPGAAASAVGAAAPAAASAVAVAAERLAAARPASAAAPAAPASGAASAAAALTGTNPCADMVKRLPNMTDALCRSARLVASGARSVGGYPLYQRDVTVAQADIAAAALQRPQAPRRPRVLVIGAMHGDELSSASLVFHWIAHALETGAEMDWRFIPALNPDGMLQKRPTRTNARGIDLNRNFPTPNWEHEAFEYWTKKTKQDARRYPGPSALSEPESRFVQDTIEGWKPDVIVSIHAPYGVLDYDGPSTPPERLGRLFLDRVGIYPGSLGNYGGVHRGVPVVTIELPSAIRTPTDVEMRQMWIDLLRWIGERLTPTTK